MTKRISYIDNTRAILIALVVLGHILNYANPKYDIVPDVYKRQPHLSSLQHTLLNAHMHHAALGRSDP